MGLLYFWLNDDSPGQRRSTQLVALTGDLGVVLLRILRFPVVGRLLTPVIHFLEESR